jgi:hypothetical protein
LIGTTDLTKIERKVIRKALEHNRKLHERLKNSFTSEGLAIEYQRFENIILKYAYGHVKYENSETEFRNPQSIWFKPVHILSQEERNAFFSVSEIEIVPEVGSRSMQRITINEEKAPIENWITVQEGIYNYTVSVSLSLTVVRLLIRNYLACIVIWSE